MIDLYIHMGLPKTGTTSIQRYLAQFDSQLEKDGLLYPRAGRFDDGHHSLFPLGAQAERKLFANLRKELIASPAERAVISSENAFYSNEENVRALLTAIDIRPQLIFYARPQIEAVESAFLHRQKVGLPYNGNIRDFYKLHRRSFDYALKIEQLIFWSSAKGVVIRLYTPERAKRSAVSDFLGIFDLSLPEGYVEKRHNQSINWRYSNIISLLDSDSNVIKNRSAIINQMIMDSQTIPQSGSGDQSLMDADLRETIKRDYLASNQRLLKEFVSSEDEAVFVERFIN